MKKIGLLGMVLVLCLAAVGAGYAMWSETLNISGTVGTGNVDVEWSLHGFGDNEDEGKDVSSVNAEILNVGVKDQETLNVTVTNAYPCITYTVLFDITSTGSVPVHLTDFSVNSGTLPAEAIDITLLGEDELGYPIPIPNSSVQLHDGDSVNGILTIHLTNEMGLEQLDSYTIAISVMAHQYNETPTQPSA